MAPVRGCAGRIERGGPIAMVATGQATTTGGGAMVSRGREGQTMHRWTRLLAVLLPLGLILMVAVGTAHAGSPIKKFFVIPSSTQAGGHPDIESYFEVDNTYSMDVRGTCECQDPKEVIVHLPAGVIGVPDSMPKCNDVEFGSILCSPDAQVGRLTVGIGGEPYSDDSYQLLLSEMGVYNLVPHPGQAALLGANLNLLNSPIYFVFSPRTGGDYGLDEHTTNIPHPFAPLTWSRLQIWGVPGDSSHQDYRIRRGCKLFGAHEKECGGAVST